jgi:hypothetical protein
MRRTKLMVVLMALVVAVAAVACSSNEGGGSASGPVEPGATSPAPPTGPAADFATLTGGTGIFLGVAAPVVDLAAVGYTEAEYSASGRAARFTSAGELTGDGQWSLTPGDEADYRTRVVVRRPREAASFNGTVVVEWLNVSSGADAAPDYTYLADELVREGAAWVGVSAQHIGVEGGPVLVPIPGVGDLMGAGKGLRVIDPDRYDSLRHPGDAFAYDLFSQIGRGLRSTDAGSPLAGLDVRTVLAAGESQSAFALTTYVNGVQPTAQVFDGFLIHSRGGSAAPLGEPDKGIDLASSLSGVPTIIRTDGTVPVMVVQTETDVLGLLAYEPARQPDSDTFRLWEVAGTAHADKMQVGEGEPVLGCAKPINRGQQVYVLRAALRSLAAWVADGTAPPEAPRLEIDRSATPLRYVLDPVGNVQGGVRTPVVDAPVDVLSGMPVEGASVICVLFGSTAPIPADQLAARFPNRDAYLAEYREATDAAIAAGFVLADDREAVLAGADPERLTEK